jgi:hypothetical protein
MRWAYHVGPEVTMGWDSHRYDLHREFAEHLLKATMRGGE